MSMLSESLLPPAVQDLVKDMDPDTKKKFIDFYLENVALNTQAGQEVADLPTPEAPAVNIPDIKAQF